MIKTEIEQENQPAEQTESVEANQEVAPTNPSSALWQLSVITLAVLLIVGFGAYLISTKTGTSSYLPVARNVDNLPALPLVTNTTSGVSSASTTTSSLSASSYNLQNNIPSGQGSPKTNAVQSTGSALSTGQTVNTSNPY